jgi:antitoxin ParD1/3/4
MGKNTSFSLGKHFSAFIEAQVAVGRFGSASDVVRAALRLLEDRETRLATLRSASSKASRAATRRPSTSTPSSPTGGTSIGICKDDRLRLAPPWARG